MKTYVRARSNYRKKLQEGKFYELVTVAHTAHTSSGTVVVVVLDGAVEVFDKEAFQKV